MELAFHFKNIFEYIGFGELILVLLLLAEIFERFHSDAYKDFEKSIQLSVNQQIDVISLPNFKKISISLKLDDEDTPFSISQIMDMCRICHQVSQWRLATIIISIICFLYIFFGDQISMGFRDGIFNEIHVSKNQCVILLLFFDFILFIVRSKKRITRIIKSNIQKYSKTNPFMITLCLYAINIK